MTRRPIPNLARAIERLRVHEGQLRTAGFWFGLSPHSARALAAVREKISQLQSRAHEQERARG